jgi:hypothetical protein
MLPALHVTAAVDRRGVNLALGVILIGLRLDACEAIPEAEIVPIARAAGGRIHASAAAEREQRCEE